MKVAQFEIKKGGYFSSDYASYHVETDLPNLSVKQKVYRKDLDFYNFRRLLRAAFPHMLVPPLPSKNTKLQEKVLQKRRL